MLIKIGLISWALGWAVSLWGKTEIIREYLGIYYVYEEVNRQIEAVGRDDGGGLGGWVNCPQCATALALPIAFLLRKTALGDALAGLGIAVLLVRWFEAARPKARWWL